MRRAADIDPRMPAARDAVKLARDQMDQARGWLPDLADGLAVTNRTVGDLEPARTPQVPEQS